MKPGNYPLTLYRGAPFVERITFKGIDLTSGVFRAQVRQHRDAPGAALIDLQTIASPAQGMSVTVSTVDGLPQSVLEIRIDKTTGNAVLPFSGSGRSADAPDVPLVWDLHITAPASFPIETRVLEGPFIISAGSTQA